MVRAFALVPVRLTRRVLYARFAWELASVAIGNTYQALDVRRPYVHFHRDPAFGWGFYGQRTHLYCDTEPHAGFTILRRWVTRDSREHFVVTSNVDGHFQKAGFADDRILEVHGSIHHLQCLTPCSEDIWPSTEDIPVDSATMRASHIPRCIHCDGVARPNILMFSDASWIDGRSSEQGRRFQSFLERVAGRTMVVIEMGAGSAIPTIRNLSEELGRRDRTTVIRINPREPEIEEPHLSLADGARQALTAIDERLTP